MKETINALVNLTVCPRSKDSSACCDKCTYKNCEGTCYERLSADSYSILMKHCTDQHSNVAYDQNTKNANQDYKIMISDILRDIGIPANVLGYGYLREAIKLAVTHSDEARDVTKWLYITVAKKFNTTGSRTERAMRHAIEVAFERGDYDAFIKYFGNTINIKSGKLKNAEFIFGIADYIKLKCNIE